MPVTSTLKSVKDMSSVKRGRKPNRIQQQDRVTDNGLKYNSFVRFNLTTDEMKNKYPDHSLDEVYRVGRILFGFESSSKNCEVVLYNSQNEAAGFVVAKHLNAIQSN